MFCFLSSSIPRVDSNIVILFLTIDLLTLYLCERSINKHIHCVCLVEKHRKLQISLLQLYLYAKWLDALGQAIVKKKVMKLNFRYSKQIQEEILAFIFVVVFNFSLFIAFRPHGLLVCISRRLQNINEYKKTFQGEIYKQVV